MDTGKCVLSSAKKHFTFSKPERVIIDTDPGVDDCMALFFALASSELKIDALTLVMGNHYDMDILSKNACLVLQLANRLDIPVVKGCTKPMKSDYHGHSGIRVHGNDARGNTKLPVEKVSDLPLKHNHKSASEFIINHCKAHPQQVSIITLGPLTNLGVALQEFPELPKYVKRVYTLAGALNIRGNVTPVAEANIHNDPHAAKMVLTAGFDLTLIPINVTNQIWMTEEFRKALKKCKKIGEFLYDITQHYCDLLYKWGNSYVPIHDPTAIMAMIKPELFQSTMVYVDVETKGELTSGTLVPDWMGHYHKDYKIEVMLKVDAEKFKEIYLQRIFDLASK